jgi:hypothetical protein
MRGVARPGGALVGLRRALRLAPLVLVVAACLPTQAMAASPSVTTEPSLRPGFKRAISDYVVRCPDRSLKVAVRRIGSARVTLDDRRYRDPRTVPIEPGRDVTIRVRQDGRVTRHFVRCLPDDFPSWRFRRFGPQTPRWYLLTPGASWPGFQSTPFVAIFDHRGVPIWWYRNATDAHDARLMGGKIVYCDANPGGFGYTNLVRYRMLRPDGTVVRSIQAVGSPTDFHDLQRIGRDYLVLSYRPREHVDLSAYGGPADATVLDSEIQRVSRRGRVVWSWNSRDHVALDETGRWWPYVLSHPSTQGGRTSYDPTHINSVEPVGDDLIISLRHTDAVYRIRMRDGRIRWKLGGTDTRRSLRVVGDPANHPLGGQHDARVWRGTITIHDNGTDLGRAPRAVRYAIDTKRRRARLLERVSDPHVTDSTCCGSARKLGNGDWLVGWGASRSSAEAVSSLLTPRGRPVFRLTVNDHRFSYRTVPARWGAISARGLRAGMDALYADEAD